MKGQDFFSPGTLLRRRVGYYSLKSSKDVLVLISKGDLVFTLSVSESGYDSFDIKVLLTTGEVGLVYNTTSQFWEKL